MGHPGSFHHDSELIKVENSISIEVEHANHGLAILNGARLSQLSQHPPQACWCYAAGALHFVHAEGIPELLALVLLVFVCGIHQLLELFESQHPVSVQIGGFHGRLSFLGGQLSSDSPHTGLQFCRGYLTVSVLIKVIEHPLEFAAAVAACWAQKSALVRLSRGKFPAQFCQGRRLRGMPLRLLHRKGWTQRDCVDCHGRVFDYNKTQIAGRKRNLNLLLCIGGMEWNGICNCLISLVCGYIYR